MRYFTISECITWRENRCTLAVDCKDCKELELMTPEYWELNVKKEDWEQYTQSRKPE